MKALVTGGASGIGKAVVAKLRSEKLNVLSTDVSPNAEDYLNITDSKQVGKFVDSHGPFDVLVNCAAIAGPRTIITETSDEDWYKTMQVNAFGSFNIMRAVIPGMLHEGWGRIVNVSSQAAIKGFEFQGAYAASKGAVISLTRTLAKEVAGTGILANVVAPTLTDTPMVADLNEAAKKAAASRIPLGRSGSADEAAELISWLVSEKMTFSTGSIFDFSGGRDIL